MTCASTAGRSAALTAAAGIQHAGAADRGVADAFRVLQRRNGGRYTGGGLRNGVAGGREGARAVSRMRAISNAGVSAGFTAFIRPAVADASGAEKLVPKVGCTNGLE